VVGPQFIAQHKRAAGRFVKNREIFSSYVVTDQLLVFLRRKVLPSRGTDFTALACGPVTVYDFDGGNPGGFATPDLEGNPFDCHVHDRHIGFNIYFSEITRHHNASS